MPRIHRSRVVRSSIAAFALVCCGCGGDDGGSGDGPSGGGAELSPETLNEYADAMESEDCDRLEGLMTPGLYEDRSMVGSCAGGEAWTVTFDSVETKSETATKAVLVGDLTIVEADGRTETHGFDAHMRLQDGHWVLADVNNTD